MKKFVGVDYSEIQLNLFLAFTFGLQRSEVRPGIRISYDILPDCFEWKLLYSANSEDEAKEICFHQMGKGEYQLNDQRFGVILGYFVDESHKFLSKMVDTLDRYDYPGHVIPPPKHEALDQSSPTSPIVTYVPSYSFSHGGSKHFFWLKPVGMKDEVTVECSDENINEAWEKFSAELKNGFVITMKD